MGNHPSVKRKDGDGDTTPQSSNRGSGPYADAFTQTAFTPAGSGGQHATKSPVQAAPGFVGPVRPPTRRANPPATPPQQQFQPMKGSFFTGCFAPPPGIEVYGPPSPGLAEAAESKLRRHVKTPFTRSLTAGKSGTPVYAKQGPMPPEMGETVPTMTPSPSAMKVETRPAVPPQPHSFTRLPAPFSFTGTTPSPITRTKQGPPPSDNAISARPIARPATKTQIFAKIPAPAGGTMKISVNPPPTTGSTPELAPAKDHSRKATPISKSDCEPMAMDPPVSAFAMREECPPAKTRLVGGQVFEALKSQLAFGCGDVEPAYAAFPCRMMHAANTMEGFHATSRYGTPQAFIGTKPQEPIPTSWTTLPPSGVFTLGSGLVLLGSGAYRRVNGTYGVAIQVRGLIVAGLEPRDHAAETRNAQTVATAAEADSTAGDLDLFKASSLLPSHCVDPVNGLDGDVHRHLAVVNVRPTTFGSPVEVHRFSKGTKIGFHLEMEEGATLDSEMVIHGPFKYRGVAFDQNTLIHADGVFAKLWPRPAPAAQPPVTPLDATAAKTGSILAQHLNAIKAAQARQEGKSAPAREAHIPASASSLAPPEKIYVEICAGRMLCPDPFSGRHAVLVLGSKPPATQPRDLDAASAAIARVSLPPAVMATARSPAATPAVPSSECHGFPSTVLPTRLTRMLRRPPALQHEDARRADAVSTGDLERRCAYCAVLGSREAMAICNDCRCVRYCGKKCQVEHWKADHGQWCARAAQAGAAERAAAAAASLASMPASAQSSLTNGPNLVDQLAELGKDLDKQLDSAISLQPEKYAATVMLEEGVPTTANRSEDFATKDGLDQLLGNAPPVPIQALNTPQAVIVKLPNQPVAQGETSAAFEPTSGKTDAQKRQKELAAKMKEIKSQRDAARLAKRAAITAAVAAAKAGENKIAIATTSSGGSLGKGPGDAQIDLAAAVAGVSRTVANDKTTTNTPTVKATNQTKKKRKG
ncbi:hypothetical protein HDU86_008089 [Geranomyces michiganensis]|nr:hypothetical protein HDU86_008089 [Geranomyces michiganensis]